MFHSLPLSHFYFYMQRRSALKNLALTVGGLVSLPAWASGWTPDSLGHLSGVAIDDEALLAEIVETFIPETTTPGAKTLKVHQFVMRMVRDCFDKPTQDTLQQGLALTEKTAQQAFGQAFAACDAPRRMEVLSRLSTLTDPVGKAFVDLTKRLTIQGYSNSEYYLVNIAKFNMVPGFYHGCVPVTKVAASSGR